MTDATQHSLDQFYAVDVGISVVMPVYTKARLEHIHRALTSIQQQRLVPRAVVVAVDNNDSLAEHLREQFDWVTVVVNRRQRGASATRNRGVEAVGTEYTAFLDDDEVADPAWLHELVLPFIESDVVGTGGRYELVWPGQRPAWFPSEFDWVAGGSYRGLPTTTAPVRNVWSGNMAVRTDAFRAVGGFRVDFGKCGSVSEPEDTDLCIRMASRGAGRWIYVPAASINHVVPQSRASLRFFVARCFAEGRGKAAMSRRLGSESAIDTEWTYAWAALGSALRRLGSLDRADTLQGFAVLLGLASAMSGYLLARGNRLVSALKDSSGENEFRRARLITKRGRVHEDSH